MVPAESAGRRHACARGGAGAGTCKARGAPRRKKKPRAVIRATARAHTHAACTRRRRRLRTQKRRGEAESNLLAEGTRWDWQAGRSFSARICSFFFFFLSTAPPTSLPQRTTSSSLSVSCFFSFAHRGLRTESRLLSCELTRAAAAGYALGPEVADGHVVLEMGHLFQRAPGTKMREEKEVKCRTALQEGVAGSLAPCPRIRGKNERVLPPPPPLLTSPQIALAASVVGTRVGLRSAHGCLFSEHKEAAAR